MIAQEDKGVGLTSPQQRQWLVRFQNRTYVYEEPQRYRERLSESIVDSSDAKGHLRTDDVKRFLSERLASGAGSTRSDSSIAPTTSSLAKLQRLFDITQVQYPHIHIRLVSSIRGGKGGFGTLLKGQSRQAGAKATTNFGACRDLQGRRLRNVNDSISRERFQSWQEKISKGEATEDEMIRALVLDTSSSSGVAGWYLQLPSWAAVGSQHKRQIQRQYHMWKRQQRQVKNTRDEARQRRDAQVQTYVMQAQAALDQAQSGVQNALQEGLRKRQQNNVEPEPPAALLTLDGDITLAYESNAWKMQSPSNFATVGIVLDFSLLNTSSSSSSSQHAFYYEVRLVSGGLAQIGWAIPGFVPNSEDGDGVGDDAFSWAYDGSRSIRLHNAQTQSYGKPWNAGDVVGCLCHQGTISFTLNGDDEFGTAFTLDLTETAQPVPVISINPGEIVELRWNTSDMEFCPEQATPVGSFLATEDVTFKTHKPNIPVAKRQKQNTDAILLATTNDSLPSPESINSNSKYVDENIQKNPTFEPQELDLESYQSAQDLEDLGMDRLKGALAALGVKCGGTLQERAARLMSLKGLEREDYPQRLLSRRKR
jgi:hypothetical protein